MSHFVVSLLKSSFNFKYYSIHKLLKGYKEQFYTYVSREHKHFSSDAWFFHISNQILFFTSFLFWFLSAMRETKEALENISVSLVVLQEGAGKLHFNLSQVCDSINRTLDDPGCHDEESDATTAQLCRSIRQSLSQLQISANFTRVRNKLLHNLRI